MRLYYNDVTGGRYLGLAKGRKLVSSLTVFRMLTPLYLGVVLGPLSLAGTINILPTLSEDFGVPLSFAGLSVTVFVLALVLVQLSSGLIVGLLGPTRTLVIGLMVFSVSCLAAAVVTSYPIFLVVRAIQGFSVGVTTPVSMGIAAETAPEAKSSTAIGAVQAAFTLGLALGPTVGGLFVEHIHWRGFYLLLASASTSSAVIVLVSYWGQARFTRMVNPMLAMKQVVAIPSVRMVSLAGFLTIFSMFGLLIFVAVWLQQSGLAGPVESGLLISIPGLIGFFCAPVAGLLGDKIGDFWVVIGGIVVFVAGGMGLLVVPDRIDVYPVLLLLLGIGVACMMTNVGAMALSIRPDLRHAVSGVFNGSRFLGGIFAPLVLTPVYEAVSIRGVLLAIVLVTIAVGVVLKVAGSNRIELQMQSRSG